MARFIAAVPLFGAVGNPLSAWLLGLDGRWGLPGWQWVFLLEGIPSVILGLSALAVLPDRHGDAHWLSAEQRDWLGARLLRDRDESPSSRDLPLLRVLAHPVIWLASLVYFLMMTTNFSYQFWAPTMIRDELHASNLATGLTTGAIAVLATAVMLAVAASSDRTRERHVHAAACAALASLGCVGAALLAHPVARVASLALVPMGVYAFTVPIWCLPSMVLRGAGEAAGIALVNALGTTGDEMISGPAAIVGRSEVGAWSTV